MLALELSPTFVDLPDVPQQEPENRTDQDAPPSSDRFRASA